MVQLFKHYTEFIVSLLQSKSSAVAIMWLKILKCFHMQDSRLYFFYFTLKIIFNIDLLIFILYTYSWAEQIRMDMCNLHISIPIQKVWKFYHSNFLSVFKIVPHLIKWSGISNSCAEEEEVDWLSGQQDIW